MTVMFVGSLPSHLIGAVSFTRYGQTAVLDDRLALDAARGGCMLLPADAPAAQAFTADELKAHGSFGSHEQAPAEFLAKKKAATIAAIGFAADAQATVEKEWAEKATAEAEKING